MDTSKAKEKVLGRFEKVLRFYWDGIPVPLLVGPEKSQKFTFVCQHLAYTPDYDGRIVPVPIIDKTSASTFVTLSSLATEPFSASCRIGSHYSPYVGVFQFRENGAPCKRSANEKNVEVRIPLECCDATETLLSSKSFFDTSIRTARVLELYKPIVKEASPLSRDSLRNIVILATTGCTSISKDLIGLEMWEINDEYGQAETEAIYFYMCLSPLYRKIMSPLQVTMHQEPRYYRVNVVNESEREVSLLHLKNAKNALEKSFIWGKKTRPFFAEMHSFWVAKFSHLEFLNLKILSWPATVKGFLEHLRSSLDAAVARIRVEFYAFVEELFFSVIPDARKSLLLTEDEFDQSVFKQIFVAADVFMVNQLRILAMDSLSGLLSFFHETSHGGRIKTSRSAMKHSLIQVELIVGDFSQPRAPSFALLIFGVSELLSAVEKSLNSLPKAECAVFRTLKLKEECLSVLSPLEVASYRSAIMHILDSAAIVIDDLSFAYGGFSVISTEPLSIARKGTNDDAVNHITFVRKKMLELRRLSDDVVYCCCFMVSCGGMKRELSHNWNNYLSLFVREFQTTILDTVVQTKERAAGVLRVLREVPSNVSELVRYFENVQAAKMLAPSLRANECVQVVAKVKSLEDIFVNIDDYVYVSIVELMRIPEDLVQEADRADSVRQVCYPLLQEKLQGLRKTTHDHIRTLSTGVTELYNMFNLETCDIAAQTCTELRELVDQIIISLRTIAHEEEVLSITSRESFDNFYSLLNYFEIIEQFWIGIYESTKLRGFYNSPVTSVNAVTMVERAREWRRLIHSSTRNLRAFVPLVRLGREQELSLSRFEDLEWFLELITTPGLRKSHWKEISRLIAAQLRDDVALVRDMTVTVKRLLDAGLPDHRTELAQIASQAHCDFEAEGVLEGMRSSAKKTHFLLEIISKEIQPRTIVTRECYLSIVRQMEGFVLSCRTIRSRPNLGALVLKSLNEWEASSERTRDMLIQWESIEEQWNALHMCLLTLKQEADTVSPNSAGSRAILERLQSASDAFSGLYGVLRKPQFSLYTAIVQDTILDFLLTAKCAMDECCVLMRSTFARKRAAFPRFNFLSDSQLLKFQSAYNVKFLSQFLPHMYPHLAVLEIREQSIVSVGSVDGSSLTFAKPLPLNADSTEVWMHSFDAMLRSSLLGTMQSCLSAYYQTSLDSWLGQWCAQPVVMSLRVEHTRGMHHVLRLGGAEGLGAHHKKLLDICDELSRIADLEAGSVQSQRRTTVAAALTYVRLALKEVHLAVSMGVSSVAELDSTSMVQTFMTSEAITTRVLGISFAYGFEFFGNFVPPPITIAQLGQAMTILVTMEVGRCSPLICDSESLDLELMLLDTVALFLGRFLIHIQCITEMSITALRHVLRGATGAGVLVCIHSSARLPATARELLSPLLQRQGPVGKAVQIPFGPDGATVPVDIHPQFGIILTVSALPEAARLLRLKCPPVRLLETDFAELVTEVLVMYGLMRRDSGSFREFAASLGIRYRHLHALRPKVITVRRFLMLLNATVMTDRSCGPPIERLLSVFMDVFSGILSDEVNDDKDFWRFLNVYLSGRFSISTAKRGSLVEGSPFHSDDDSDSSASTIVAEVVKIRFAELMATHRRVLLLGPPFSGKTRLWRDWVGSTRHTIISQPLITSGEFYGTPQHSGLLGYLMSQALLTEKWTVVVEHITATSPLDILFAEWPATVRIPGAEDGTLVMGHFFHLVVTAQHMRDAKPSMIDGFAIFALDPPARWNDVLPSALDGLPEKELAGKIITVLLPAVAESVEKVIPNLIGSGDRKLAYAAFGQRVAVLCRRWHQYVMNTAKAPTDLPEAEEDMLAERQLFVVRCTIFAVCWCLGHALPSDQRDTLSLTLLNIAPKVLKLLEDYHLDGEIFPSLEMGSANILELVVVPQGWKSFDEAAHRCGLPLTWAKKYGYTNAQSSMSLQTFTLPSRESTLSAVECLLNCGQHVLLRGANESGKTTVLQAVGCNSTWISQFFCSNDGLSTTALQCTVSSSLSRRSNGCYGPPLGRKLVVCIDDLHLAPQMSTETSLANCLIAFAEKFSALTTHEIGTIPTEDVVFFGTINSQSSDRKIGSGMLCGCVDVSLPPFQSEEISSGVLKLLEGACAKRRGDGFPRQCVNFMNLAHAVYIESRDGLNLQVTMGHNSPVYDSRHEQADAKEADVEIPSDGSVAVLHKVPSFFALHIGDALFALDAARVNSLSNISDSQAVGRLFSNVGAIYRDMLLRHGIDEKGQEQFLRGLCVAADGALHKTVRGNVDFATVVEQISDSASSTALQLDTVSAENTSTVADWIVDFDMQCHEETIEILSSMYDRRSAAGNANNVNNSGIQNGSATTSAKSTRYVSVVFFYPDSLREAALRAETLRGEVSLRRMSFILSSRRGSGSVTLSSLSGRSNNQKTVSLTYQTTWLTTRLIFMRRKLDIPGSHLIWVGLHTAGVRRLFRILCCTVRIPFFYFCNDFCAPQQYTYEIFRKEMRAAITYACMNNVHCIVYLPYDILYLPGVLYDVDVMVRCGDVSGLFSDEERQALMSGFHVTHNQRVLKSVALMDDTELRRRIRLSFNFIFHLDVMEAVQRLGKKYPFLLQCTNTASLSTDELRASQLREITLAVLRGESEKGELLGSDEEFNPESPLPAGVQSGPHLTTRMVCEAICIMYEFVAKSHPSISLEQLIECASLVRDLRCTVWERVHRSSAAVGAIAHRGDEAMKLVKAEMQRCQVAAEQLSSASTKAAELRQKLEKEEAELVICQADAKQAEEVLQKASLALQKQKEALESSLQAIEAKLDEAARHLKKTKTAYMRSMSVSRVPDKGTLLIRAVYRLLGEEMPKGNEGPNEVWFNAMKTICTREFTTTFTSILPSSIGDITPLISLRNELDRVRYGTTLPYAQFIADYFVAFVNYAEFLKSSYESEKANVSVAEDKVRRLMRMVEKQMMVREKAEVTVVQTKKSIADCEAWSESLGTEQNAVSDGEGRLMRYVGLVDRFSRFIGAQEPEERARQALCATADALLIAGFYSLYAMHPNALETYAALQKLLIEKVDPQLVSTDPAKAFINFFYQTHNPRLKVLLQPSMPWEYQIALISLYERTASRWTVFGGVGETFENFVREYLMSTCTGCITVSALDPMMKVQLVEAMKTGEGVLLCDVQSVQTLDFIRSLNPLLVKLKQLASLTEEETENLGGKNSEERVDKERRTLNVYVEGREVLVSSKFFLVCVSTSIIPMENPLFGECANIYNCFSPVKRDTRYHWLLLDAICTPAVSSKLSALRDEVKTRQCAYLGDFKTFASAYDTAAALLSTNLKDIQCSKGDKILDKLEDVLAEVDAVDSHLSQSYAYIQSTYKTVWESWKTLFFPLFNIADALEFIESVKLQRPWNEYILDSFLCNIMRLSPALLHRIAPQSFSDLAPSQKHFYALINFVCAVVDCMSGGWPLPFRGTFSIFLLCSALSIEQDVATSNDKVPVSPLRAVLNEVGGGLVLTPEQFRVLRVVLGDPSVSTYVTEEYFAEANVCTSENVGTDALEQRAQLRRRIMKQFYASSSDAVLQKLAQEEKGRCDSSNSSSSFGTSAFGDAKVGSGDGVKDFYVSQFFYSLAEMDLEGMEHHSGYIYRTFMASVTGTKPIVSAEETVKVQTHTSGVTIVADDHRAEQGPASRGGHSKGQSHADNEISVMMSMEVQLHRSALHRLPLCLASPDYSLTTLQWLRNEVSEANWDFQWLDITLLGPHAPIPAIIRALQPLTDLATSSRRPHAQRGKKGICVAVVMRIDFSVFSKTALNFLFKEWHRLTYLFLNSPTQQKSNAASSFHSSAQSSLCLALLCSNKVQHILWPSKGPSMATLSYMSHLALPCLYSPRCAVTPQQRLIEALLCHPKNVAENDAVLLCDTILGGIKSQKNRCLAMQKNRESDDGETASPPSDLVSVSLAKQGGNDDPLSSFSLSVLSAMEKAVGDLQKWIRLLTYELTVCYVVDATRRQMRESLYERVVLDGTREATGRKEAMDAVLHFTVEDPNGLNLLNRLLCDWVRHQYNSMLERLAALKLSSSGFPDGNPTLLQQATKDDIPQGAAILEVPSLTSYLRVPDDLPPNYGLQSYRFLRDRRPGWQLLLREHFLGTLMSADIPTPPLPYLLDSLFIEKGGRAGLPLSSPQSNTNESGANDSRALQREQSQSVSRRQRHCIEREVESWRTMLFSNFKKFAFHFLPEVSGRTCTPQSGALSTSLLSTPFEPHCMVFTHYSTWSTEKEALWQMISTLVGIPTDADGISCLWGDYEDSAANMARWQRLQLEARHPDTLITEILNTSSDLMELCGEETAVDYHRGLRQQGLTQALFGKWAMSLISCNSNYPSRPSKDLPGIVHPIPISPWPAIDPTSAASQTLFCPLRSSAELIWVLEHASLRSSMESLSSGSRPEATQLVLHTVEMLGKAASGDYDPFAIPLCNLQLWLPVLRYHWVDVRLLASGLRLYLLDMGRRCSSGCADRSIVSYDNLSRMKSIRNADKERGMYETILVVMLRRHTTPGDVLLDGVVPSLSLQTQISALTGWTPEQWTCISSGSKDSSASCNSSKREDVVIAARSVTLKKNIRRDGSTARFYRMFVSSTEANDSTSPNQSFTPLREATFEVPTQVDCVSQHQWNFASWPLVPSVNSSYSSGGVSEKRTSSSSPNFFVTAVDAVNVEGQAPASSLSSHRSNELTHFFTGVPLPVCLHQRQQKGTLAIEDGSCSQDLLPSTSTARRKLLALDELVLCVAVETPLRPGSTSTQASQWPASAAGEGESHIVSTSSSDSNTTLKIHNALDTYLWMESL